MVEFMWSRQTGRGGHRSGGGGTEVPPRRRVTDYLFWAVTVPFFTDLRFEPRMEGRGYTFPTLATRRLSQPQPNGWGSKTSFGRAVGYSTPCSTPSFACLLVTAKRRRPSDSHLAHKRPHPTPPTNRTGPPELLAPSALQEKFSLPSLRHPRTKDEVQTRPNLMQMTIVWCAHAMTDRQQEPPKSHGDDYRGRSPRRGTRILNQPTTLSGNLHFSSHMTSPFYLRHGSGKPL